jgi:hypothetical protein
MVLHADADQLLSHCSRLTQTSLFTDSFARVGSDTLLFLLLVFSPSLPAVTFTGEGRCYTLLFDRLESSPSLPADTFTSVTSSHVVCSRNRMTR